MHDLVLLRAQKALEAGCDGVISSPQEAHAIRAMIANRTGSMDGSKFLIVAPGIRPRNSTKHDHKRHSDPAAAIKSGADFLVVGRPIREAPDPIRAAQDVISEMQTAFDRQIQ